MKAQFAVCLMSLLVASPAQAMTYAFTDESAVKFTAYAPLRENGVHGVCRKVLGRLEVPEGDYEKAFAGISVPINAFEAKRGLDQHALTAIEAPLFPSTAFVSKKFHVVSRRQEADGTHLAGTVEGTLAFHGVQRPLVAEFTAVDGLHRSTFDSAFWISLSEFGIEAPTVLIITIRDKVKIDLHLVAEKL